MMIALLPSGSTAIGATPEKAASVKRRVLGDVGHPELVAALAAKGTVDEVLSRRQAGRAAPLAGAVTASDPGALHQHRDRIVADPDPAPEHELGVHPVGAIAAVGGDVHLADQVGQPRVPNRTG